MMKKSDEEDYAWANLAAQLPCHKFPVLASLLDGLVGLTLPHPAGGQKVHPSPRTHMVVPALR